MARQKKRRIARDPNAELSDRDLLTLALEEPSPENPAAGELLVRFMPAIRRFISARIPESDVEDTLSLVLERALRNLGTVSASLPRFRLWLYQIARHAISDYFRKADRRSVRPLAEDSSTAVMTAVGPESSAELNEALAELGEIDRALLLLSSVYGYKNDEIRDIMMRSGYNLGQSAIYSRISRARKKLRRHLSFDGPAHKVRADATEQT